MGKIKELSTRLWKELPKHPVKYKGKKIKAIRIVDQAAELVKVLPSLDYNRLRDLRSRETYKEQPNEIETFKKVFALELAYLEEGDKANNELDELQRTIAELQKKVEQGEKLEDLLNASLATQEAQEKKLEQILKLIQDIKKEE